MRTIWKYNLPTIQKRAQFAIPKGGEIIHVACQQPKIISFWVEVDSENEKEFRYFEIAGTGNSIIENYVHVGTVLDGAYVWHLHESK